MRRRRGVAHSARVGRPPGVGRVGSFDPRPLALTPMARETPGEERSRPEDEEPARYPCSSHDGSVPRESRAFHARAGIQPSRRRAPPTDRSSRRGGPSGSSIDHTICAISQAAARRSSKVASRQKSASSRACSSLETRPRRRSLRRLQPLGPRLHVDPRGGRALGVLSLTRWCEANVSECALSHRPRSPGRERPSMAPLSQGRDSWHAMTSPSLRFRNSPSSPPVWRPTWTLPPDGARRSIEAAAS